MMKICQSSLNMFYNIERQGLSLQVIPCVYMHICLNLLVAQRKTTTTHAKPAASGLMQTPKEEGHVGFL